MSDFSLSYHSQELLLAHPFTIARGTKESVQNVVIKLSADGITGYGEAAPNKRYDEDAPKVRACLNEISSGVLENIQSLTDLTSRLEHHTSSVQSAKSAIEMAWLDWWGKSRDQPLWQLWDAPSNTTPSTSYTIALDDIDIIKKKVREADDYPILKVKLGTNRDFEIIKAIRGITDKPIRVDANEGWADLETAKDRITFLADKNIEIIEQPMPSACDDEMKELYKWSPLPLMADERFTGGESLDEIAEMFDGINIKLSKIGSMAKARKVIAEAAEHDLEVMIGCMIESSLGIAAGALLGTWADYVDLDGHLLVSDDPFEGLTLTDDKRICLSDKPGLGVLQKSIR